jgi:predicted alpha/beta hydrolase family esterase
MTNFKSKFKNIDNIRILTVPGLNGSGPLHWQSIWEHKYGFTRIEQDSWDNPDYYLWADSFYRNIEKYENESEVVIVAHSLGCHLVIKSFPLIKYMTKGILLVAPPDLNANIIKKDLSGFYMSGIFELDVPGFLIYSVNDPYASAQYSVKYGQKLGLDLVNIGKRGHINSESDIGDWDEGATYLNRLLKSIHAKETAANSISNFQMA